jgi:hypothetical protein
MVQPASSRYIRINGNGTACMAASIVHEIYSLIHRDRSNDFTDLDILLELTAFSLERQAAFLKLLDEGQIKGEIWGDALHFGYWDLQHISPGFVTAAEWKAAFEQSRLNYVSTPVSERNR